MPPQQNLLRSKAAEAHSKQSLASGVFQSSNVKDAATTSNSRDDRMLKELQQIGVALKEIKAGGTTCPNHAGKAHPFYTVPLSV